MANLDNLAFWYLLSMTEIKDPPVTFANLCGNCLDHIQFQNQLTTLKMVAKQNIWIIQLLKFCKRICSMKTKSTGLIMFLSQKWLSILPSIQAFRRLPLRSSMVRTLHCLLTCHCSESLLSTIRHKYLLARWKSYPKRLKWPGIMPNKLNNILITASTNP